nr:3-hydroxyacyl-CoA dehydrogenase family protein [Kofleriaceae bacterium]
MRTLRNIVVLGANGVMGSGSAALFASAGLAVTLLARTRDRAEAGRARAEALAKGRIAPGAIAVGSYDHDLEAAVAGADFVLEAVAEDEAVKRELLARVDRAIVASEAGPGMITPGTGTIVATVTSGLSIATLADALSPEVRRRFLGVHLFNPPTQIRGTEVIGHVETDASVIAHVRAWLETDLDRVVIECADLPAFAGNRIGFKVLNEVAQQVELYGVAAIDQLLGAHTGRALPPLATIDLVGWDVHAAIVDHLWIETADEAHASFRLPDYMRRGIERGHLGRKTRELGGFYRVVGKGELAERMVLDPASGDYRPFEAPPVPTFVERMRAAVRACDHAGALDALCRADGDDAALLRRVLLGYVSYALCRVGECVTAARDVDLIMGFGFHWAPPTMLVDAIGAGRTAGMLDAMGLPVPPVVDDAARTGRPLYAEATLPTKYFAAA